MNKPLVVAFMLISALTSVAFVRRVIIDSH